MIFPNPDSVTKTKGIFKIASALTISCDNSELLCSMDYLKLLLKNTYGINCEISNGEADVKIKYAAMSREEYELDVSYDGVSIKAGDLRGAIYAASSLVQLIEKKEYLYVPCTFVRDFSYKSIRGVHFFMPERSKIADFKKLIDLMAFVKMNTVIIEVGGGMEYERHPEINTAWEKFCKTVNNFPGLNGYKSFQGSDFYWKDALHTELCGGSFLTKSEVKDIVDYCKKRGMDVIPEIQALSHCYYLTIAHPEIAELSDDPFPDTYCPSNEKSYELYFDVAEEVIEAFNPTTVSIGHDEIRVLGWCDKCKDKSGHELVGNDILRLYDFYKKHGIRIAMWAESAQVFENYLGVQTGSDDIETVDKFGRYYKLPATYKCIDMLPDDILMIDWYHSMGHDSEGCFNSRGFDVIYGNFHGSLFGEWDERSSKKFIKGAEVSSWCVATPEIFARDGIIFEMLFSAYILWSSEYHNERFEDVCDRIRALIPLVHAVCKGRPSDIFLGKKIEPIFVGDENTSTSSLKLSKASIPDVTMKKALSSFGDILHGVPVHTGLLVVKKEFFANYLIFIHNCKEKMPFYPSHYYCDENRWGIGAYAVCYEDGTVETANVYYGREIGVSNLSYRRHRDSKYQPGTEIDIELVGKNKKVSPPYYTLDNAWLESLTYNATPVVGKDTTVFVFEWKNPHPDKKIIKIKPYSVATDFQNKSSTQEISLFAIGYIE